MTKGDVIFFCFVTMFVTAASAWLASSHYDEGLRNEMLEPYVKQRHDYSEVRIISASGVTVVRAVESPGILDDRTVETIIDGKLISRTRPADFDQIWESAKRMEVKQ